MKRRMNSTRFFVPFVFTLFALVPLSALASDIRIGEDVSVNSNESISSNLYAAGAQVTLSGTEERDAVVAGGRVIVNGPVAGDVLAFGGTIDVLDRVSGDVRIAGGQVTVAGSVAGDVIIAGGRIHLLPGSSVSGDVIIVGGNIELEGAVNGSVRLYGGTVVVNALLGGPLFIRAGDSVSFGENAVVGSTLAYSAPEEAFTHESAVLGDDVSFTPLDIPTRALGPTGIGAVLAAAAGVILAVKLLTGVVTAVALVMVFPKFSRTVALGAISDFWKSLGIGFIALVVTPAAIMILALTIAGFMAAMMIMVVYVLFLLLSALYAGIILGALIAKRVKKEHAVSWKWALAGTLLLFLISLVPFAGWLTTFVFFLAALGSLGRTFYHRAFEAA